MQAYINSSIGIRTQDMSEADYDAFKARLEVVYQAQMKAAKGHRRLSLTLNCCGEDYGDDQYGEIIELRSVNNPFAEKGSPHFINKALITDATWEADEFDEILKDFDLMNYKDKIDLYIYCTEY